MHVQCQLFWQDSTDSWQTIFQDAANFATELSKDSLINISHSCDRNQGAVAVWYWAENEPAGEQKHDNDDMVSRKI